MKKVEALEKIKMFFTYWGSILSKCGIDEKQVTTKYKKCEKSEYNKILEFHKSLTEFSDLLTTFDIKNNYYTEKQWKHLEEMGFDGVEVESRKQARKNVIKFFKQLGKDNAPKTQTSKSTS